VLRGATVFRFSQLLLRLLLPFLLMLTLGGSLMERGHLWSLTSPLGALLSATCQALVWLSRLVLLAISILVQPFVLAITGRDCETVVFSQ
jgi:hypothetical protein